MSVAKCHCQRQRKAYSFPICLLHRFSGAALFENDLTSWDLAAATDISYMFDGATSFTGAGLSGWNVGAVTTTRDM